MSARDFVTANEQAQALADPHARALIEAVKGQLLIVMVNRLGGEIRVPVSEVDGTGGYLLHMRVDGDAFVFSTGKKN